MDKKVLATRDLCYIGIFTAIIAASAQISIPLPYVSMTLQTLVIPLAGIVLGAKKGVYATVVYILLGAVGLPVFTGFSAGLGTVFGARGGFILSFPLMALTAGIGATKPNKGWLALWLIIGGFMNYLCGMLMFKVVMSSDMRTAFTTCVLPFIPTAIVKVIIVDLIGLKLKKMIIKAGVLV